jgi:hypothetical protein
MTNNIALGADGQANHTLGVLRGGTFQGALATNVSFLPGLKLNADPALEVAGSYRSPAGRLLELDLTTGPGLGGWVGLHLDLPAKDLRQAGVLGFGARFAAPEIMVARVCLRSGTKSGFEDCFFDKHMLLRPEEASHIDALSIHHRADLPVQAPWRELIIFMPTRAFQASLIDLRVFIV